MPRDLGMRSSIWSSTRRAPSLASDTQMSNRVPVAGGVRHCFQRRAAALSTLVPCKYLAPPPVLGKRRSLIQIPRPAASRCCSAAWLCCAGGAKRSQPSDYSQWGRRRKSPKTNAMSRERCLPCSSGRPNVLIGGTKSAISRPTKRRPNSSRNVV